MDIPEAMARLCRDLQHLLPTLNLQQSLALRSSIEQALSAPSLHTLLPPEQKFMTVLIADLRGFTALTDRHASLNLVDMLNRYLARMCQVIVQHGGRIDKFMGDSIMALFGLDNRLPDDASRALACAVEMQLAMDGINAENRRLQLPELYMGIGINTGDVVAAHLGSHLHREYTVIGDTVNLTSRIEAQSLRGQILMSDSTYSLVHDHVDVASPNLVHVKGKQAPICMYELLATHKPRALIVPRRTLRKSPRVNVEIPFAFQLMEGKRVLSKTWSGCAIDLGYHGLLANVPVYLTPLSEIRLQLITNPLSIERRAVYARILKCQVEPGGYRVSMEFSGIDETAQGDIKHYVDQMVST